MNHVNQAKNQLKAAVVFFKIQFLFSGVVSVWIMFARAKVYVDQKARPKFWLSFSNFNTVVSLGCLLARDKKNPKNLNWISCTQELKNRETSACCNSFRQHQMIFQKIWKRGPNSERPSYCLILWNVSKGVSRLTRPSIRNFLAFQKNELSLGPVIFLVSHVTCAVDPWC